MKFGRFCLSENFSISSKLLNFFIKWWRKYYGYLFNYVESIMRSLLSFFFSSLFIFYWRIIPLQNFAVLCQTSTRISHAAAAAKSLQSCPTLCDPMDGSPPGSPVPGILQARKLEWVAISFSNGWKWKVSRSVVSDSQRPHGLQPTRLLSPRDFPGKSTGVGCHRLLRLSG